MVTIDSIFRTGTYCWEVHFSSGLGDPTFYIYLDGELVDETKQTKYTIAINPDESYMLEVLDDPDTRPMQVFPGKIRLSWFYVEDCQYYRIDEYVGAEWVERKQLPEKGGYLKWESRFLEDGQAHTFRVVPVGTDGNQGTAKQFVILMVRHPDVPDVSYAYSNSTKKITITEN